MADDSSHEPWVAVFDAVPVPLWIIGADGDLWYANRAWQDITGVRTMSRRISGGWLQAVHEDDRVRCTTAFRSAATLGSRVEVDVRMRAADGYRWWSLVGAPHQTPDGDVESFIGASQDTTASRVAQHRLRDLSARLVAAQEAERGRIARELHDDLAQRVALLASKLGTAARARPFTSRVIREHLADARNMLQELSAGIHLLAHELHPPKLKLLGLAPTLKALCAELSSGSQLPIQFTQRALPPTLGDEVSLCVFRVTQEALQNAVKHSGATHVDVQLGVEASHLTLRVIDDGRGFDPHRAPQVGLGLMTMRERVELLGGRLRVLSEPARGTTIEAIVPLLSAPVSL
jgi:PAS domain S-box-containing protein